MLLRVGKPNVQEHTLAVAGESRARRLVSRNVRVAPLLACSCAQYFPIPNSMLLQNPDVHFAGRVGRVPSENRRFIRAKQRNSSLPPRSSPRGIFPTTLFRFFLFFRGLRRILDPMPSRKIRVTSRSILLRIGKPNEQEHTLAVTGESVA